jgi:phage terminase Nu1 subunit (DNA packaging protein)
MALTKTAFAKALGVSKPTISRYCAQGMAGHLPDGTIDEKTAREWVRTNIRPHVTDAGAGGAIGAGAPVDDLDDDEDAIDDIAHERARLTRLKADMAQIELERMKGGTAEEVKLRLIETTIFHLWWVVQRHSPHALTGRFIGNGWLNIKDGPSCARASSLILARDCEIMRQMATVVEQAIAGQLQPVNGRRDLLVPWEQHRLDWAKGVGDVFQSEIDDRALLVAGKGDGKRPVEHVDSDGEIHTTTQGIAKDD